MTIQTATADRKAMAKAIAAHLGTETKYLGMPTCAYQAGPYTINRDGSIEGEDFEAIRDFLVQEGYAADIPGNEAPDDSEATDPVVTAFVEALENVPSIETVHAAADQEAENTETHVTIPLRDFTPTSLMNLLRMLYARQTLIAAMTKSDLIRIDEEMISRLTDEKPETIEEISEILKDEIREGLVSGVNYEDGKLTMAFPFDENKPTEWTAYSGLMLAAAARAKDMKHAVTRRLDPSDGEMKYFCRNWLLQLGMGGPEFKEQRRVLLGHLSGFAAFRTADKMDAHKAKLASQRKAKREENVSEVTPHDPD